MNLGDVQEQLAAALDTIDPLRVHPWWADRVNPPAAVVAMPDEYSYDTTLGRGYDEITLPVFVLVSRADARTATYEVGSYAAGGGPRSVKAALEAHDPMGTWESLRVTEVVFAEVRVAGADYLGAEFKVHISGEGDA